MATIEITGRVVKDVVLERTPNGKEITSFSIASNRKYTDDKGKQHDEVDFYHITCWKDLAVATQFLKREIKSESGDSASIRTGLTRMKSPELLLR